MEYGTEENAPHSLADKYSGSIAAQQHKRQSSITLFSFFHQMFFMFLFKQCK
jgi:hypothetical protein